MPSPGPQKTKPPKAGWPNSIKRPMHQLVVPKNTKALATPAPKRSVGHSSGQGSTRPAVSTTVATKPPRTKSAWPGIGPKRRPSHGSDMNSSAPTK